MNWFTDPRISLATLVFCVIALGAINFLSLIVRKAIRDARAGMEDRS